MSLTIGLALTVIDPNHKEKDRIMSVLDIPNFVKQAFDERFIAYMRAIRLDGYDKRKIRKMIVLGNKGKQNIF